MIALGISSPDDIGSDMSYSKAQYIRSNTCYIVSPTSATTYYMYVWSDYKSSSDLNNIDKLEMKAIRLK